MFCFVFSFSLLLNLNINAIMRLNWLISIYALDQAEINYLILSTDHWKRGVSSVWCWAGCSHGSRPTCFCCHLWLLQPRSSNAMNHRFADNTSECWTPTNAVYSMFYTGKRCGIFYTAPHKSPMISKLCSGDVCTCAEGEKNCVLWCMFCLSGNNVSIWYSTLIFRWLSKAESHLQQGYETQHPE